MIYFTADEHYGHKNIISYSSRPFKDLDEMHEQLAYRFNETVSFGDCTVHLGDFSLDERLVSRYLSVLNGTHVLVPGNHDRCHPRRGGHSRSVSKYISYGFSEVCASGQSRRRIGEHWVNLCHLPYTSHDGRFSEYLPTDSGEWLLHGHVHERWKVKGRMINVGVDQWDYRPVSKKQILEVIENE